MSFHSDMSDFRHKDVDSRDDMMVSSGIKTVALMVMNVIMVQRVT